MVHGVKYMAEFTETFSRFAVRTPEKSESCACLPEEPFAVSHPAFQQSFLPAMDLMEPACLLTPSVTPDIW